MTDQKKIIPLTPQLEKRIRKNPLLHIDTFIIPSPYVKDPDVEKDYSCSYVWQSEGEIMGFMLVYSDKKKHDYHLYKLVTSPFGRGMGIGSAFIEHLSKSIPDNSTIYLYVWEKQIDTLEFFKNKGFTDDGQIVYRNLIYVYFSASRENILNKVRTGKEKKTFGVEEVGKTRHDARKTLRLMSNMVDMLSIDNCGRIVEDINRETTSLINILNVFRDSMQIMHEVNMRELILERIVPIIKSSPVSCRIQININTDSSVVSGYHVNISRALVNIISNSLDAIQEADRKGFIQLSLYDTEENIFLTIKDNGTGIAGELMKPGIDGIPLFVGKTTKMNNSGEGVGTQQIFSTFGKQNIRVKSIKGKGTAWKIRFVKSISASDKYFTAMERKFNEFQTLWVNYELTPLSSRNRITAFIWQLRKMELFLFEIIQLFSNYHNIRTIYRMLLAFFQDYIDIRQLAETIYSYRADQEKYRKWLFKTAARIKKRKKYLLKFADPDKFKGALFKSYGQGLESNIIFTLDPETCNFFATERKLAEHLDFVPYLHKDKNSLLRGEFKGDANNEKLPVVLGVWSVESEKDLNEKLKLIQKGAKALMKIGLPPGKKLSFYQTTYTKWKYDIDTYKSATLKSFSDADPDKLQLYIREIDDELQDMVFAVD